jgi:hypothetical protein
VSLVDYIHFDQSVAYTATAARDSSYMETCVISFDRLRWEE